MKKIILSAITAALILLPPAGIVGAAESKAVCPVHAVKCFEKDADYFCITNEEGYTSKLVRGRAGQLEYQRVPTSQLKLHKCAAVEHPTGE